MKSLADDTANDLYDLTAFRTLELRFSQPNWWQQLTANYDREINIPADLTVDGVTYTNVGVRFKGVTSYRATGGSQKKSFNIDIDQFVNGQRLMGYKTLNLNNAFSDSSFMRDVLYANYARLYYPGPKANFVMLRINGANWGVYLNVQQQNGEMIREFFHDNNGDRWRAGAPFGFPGGGGGGPGGGGMNFGGDLAWLSTNVAAYTNRYILKSNNNTNAWTNLVHVIDVLNNTPYPTFEESLQTSVNRGFWGRGNRK